MGGGMCRSTIAAQVCNAALPPSIINLITLVMHRPLVPSRAESSPQSPHGAARSSLVRQLGRRSSAEARLSWSSTRAVLVQWQAADHASSSVL